MNVQLRDIDKTNFRAVIGLNVAAGQEAYVAPNVRSIAESCVFTHLVPKAIYADDDLVGFALYGRDPGTRAYWIVRFMIDAGWQSKGYGRASLTRLVKHISALQECREIFLTFVPGNRAAKKLYESFGFAATGETDESGEIIMRYKVAAEVGLAAVSTSNVP